MILNFLNFVYTSNLLCNVSNKHARAIVTLLDLHRLRTTSYIAQQIEKPYMKVRKVTMLTVTHTISDQD